MADVDAACAGRGHPGGDLVPRVMSVGDQAGANDFESGRHPLGRIGWTPRVRHRRLPRLGLVALSDDLFYGVVSSQTEVAFELLIERDRAETFIAEVEADEPETAALLRVEPVELG